MAEAHPGRTSNLPALLEGGGAALIFIGAFVPWVVTVALVASVPVRGVKRPLGVFSLSSHLRRSGLLAWRWYTPRARWVHLVIALLGASAIALTLV